MAYVVARPKGRFEIRESVHTHKGPRARSLANFARLSDEVLATARRRASRPFDTGAVRASAARVGATAHRDRHPGPEMRRFVESSRRMAGALEPQPPRSGPRRDPGEALIDLLNFAEQVTPFTPVRAPEPLEFPPLAAVAAATARREAEQARAPSGPDTP